MKIKFLSQYTDPANPAKIFPAGSTAEFTDPEGQRLVDNEIAVGVDRDTRAKKTGVIMTECVPPDSFSGAEKKAPEKKK